MKPIVVQRVIQRPLAEVFAAFADVDTLESHFFGATAVLFQTEQREGVGTTWVHRSGPPGQETIDSRTLIRHETNRAVALTTDDKNIVETLEFEFSEAPEGTRVVFTRTEKKKGFFSKGAKPAHIPLIEEFMASDLADMAEYLESREPAS